MDAGGRASKITGPFTSQCSETWVVSVLSHTALLQLCTKLGDCGVAGALGCSFSCDFQGESNELGCWGLLQTQQTLAFSIGDGPFRTWWLSGGSNSERVTPRQLWRRTSIKEMKHLVCCQRSSLSLKAVSRDLQADFSITAREGPFFSVILTFLIWLNA